jgi:hypothetical protein
MQNETREKETEKSLTYLSEDSIQINKSFIAGFSL